MKKLTVAEREIIAKRRRYYLEEAATLATTVLAVLFSKAYHAFIEKGFVASGLVKINIPTVIAACFVSLIVYGLMHSKLKYSEAKKPELIKRLVTAALYGVGFQDILSGGG